jgi:serine/threonine protein kinase
LFIWARIELELQAGLTLQGICHRDLSGNNILLKWVKDSEASKPYPVVYVCDFGMAKVGERPDVMKRSMGWQMASIKSGLNLPAHQL